ncbi:MAG: DNA primase [Dehalococcoidia bacterium]|nr:DNA primase [Dehalococcoidia bacterium]
MSTISDIKERVDIVSVVSEYVQLTKTGKNYRGLCPFHSEKHGSFYVFPDRQTWHCFGACGTGGDAFSFIMKKENVDFKEAMRLLAARAGITLEQPTPASVERDEEKDRLLSAVDIAAEFFRGLLLNSPLAASAREYVEKRRIPVTSEVGEAFRVGYSPPGWTTLKDMLRARGFTEQELKDTGLVVEREDGSTYDRFRDRLMFPVFDGAGKVIGFGARALGNAEPKYLNSPQSRVFDKGRVLYGIHRARAAARRQDRIILVEGYTDVLQAHDHEWDCVVAPMGTSLTEHHAATLSRITRNIYLALDGDEAGQSAAMKTIRETTGRFREAFGQKTVADLGPGGKQTFRSVLDADIRIIVLPDGRDPDEILLETPDTWKQLVETATPYVDFYVDTLTRSADTSTARGKRELLAACEPIISELEDSLDRSRFYSRLSRTLKIPERDLMAELGRLDQRTARSATPHVPSPERPRRRASGMAVEEYCLCLLLNHPALKQRPPGLEADQFESTENRQVYEAWCSNPDIDSLRSSLDDPLVEHLDFLLSHPFPPGIPSDAETQNRALDECILRLQERQAKRHQFMMETTLERERQEQGIEAELATLDKAGTTSNERLHQIFVQKNHRGREKRG